MNDLIKAVQEMENYLKTFSETVLARIDVVEAKVEDIGKKCAENRRELSAMKEVEATRRQGVNIWIHFYEIRREFLEMLLNK